MRTYTVARSVLRPLPLPVGAHFNHRVHALAVQLGLAVQIHHVYLEQVRCPTALNTEIEPRSVGVFVRSARTVRSCPNADLRVGQLGISAILMGWAGGDYIWRWYKRRKEKTIGVSWLNRKTKETALESS